METLFLGLGLQSTRSPKLRLLCRLAYVRHQPNLQENYDIFQIDLWQKLHDVKRVLWNFLEPSHFSLREKFLKILLSSSLNPSLKRSRANTAKSRQPQVSWGQQCFVWCEVITKLDNINTIMLWSLPVILVNFSFFSPYCGIFLSHHIRLVFFLFFHEGGIFFKILICLSMSPT